MAGYWWKSNISNNKSSRGRAAFVAHTDFYNHSMLHQTFTPPPFLHFPFHHRHPSASVPAPAPAPLLHPAASPQPPPAARSLQGEKVMEGVEVAGLRRARRPEPAPVPVPAPAPAPSQQQQLQAPAVSDETAWVADHGGFLGDDFSIDDLLDFGGLETEMVEEPDEDEPKNEKGDAFGIENKSNPTTTPCADAAFVAPPPQPPVSDIDLPAHDAAEFEWMTSLMEDESLPAYPGVAPYRPATQTKTPAKTRHYHHEPKPEPVWVVDTPPSAGDIRLSVDDLAPVKAKRSKRRRTAGHAWPAATTTSSSSSSSSSPTSSYLSFYSSSAFPYEPAKPKPKKRGRKPKKHHSDGGHAAAGGVLGDRRCTHCGAQKTPQWRAGPSGPKTLCNACGVRFKSGRLVPEYRPAASPSFLSHVHSNSHRKVLEMRRKKDEQLLAPPVAS